MDLRQKRDREKQASKDIVRLEISKLIYSH